MRPLVSLTLLALLSSAELHAVEETANPPSRLTQVIRANTPKFSPPPAAPSPPRAPSVAEASIPLDSDVIEMPKFFVEDSKLARIDADKLLSKPALAAKMRRAYRNSLNDLEWALNSFSIPFLTPSVAARARAKYENDQRLAEQTRLTGLIEVTSQIDPQAAAELRLLMKRR